MIRFDARGYALDVSVRTRFSWHFFHPRHQKIVHHCSAVQEKFKDVNPTKGDEMTRVNMLVHVKSFPLLLSHIRRLKVLQRLRKGGYKSSKLYLKLCGSHIVSICLIWIKASYLLRINIISPKYIISSMSVLLNIYAAFRENQFCP